MDLSKHVPIKIIEDEECSSIVLRGGIGGGIFIINSSTIKERITQEINELENQLKYAGEFLQYDKLYEINCKLEVLRKVLLG